MKSLPVLILFISISVFLAVYGQYTAYVNEPVPLTQTEEVDIPRGANLLTVSQALNQAHLISQPHWFILLAVVNGQARSIKHGTYAIRSGMTPKTILETLVTGKAKQFPVVFVEGWTLAQIRAELAQHPELKQTLPEVSDQDLMPRIAPQCREAGCQHPEGWIFPSTYHVTKGTSDIEVLGRAYQTMRGMLQPAWEGRERDLPLASPYQALVLASIVEKETADTRERPAIAGVFLRRLQKGMKLQTDPTVIYGLGLRFDGDIRTRDLRTDTPYNTYTREGLPPTPIAMPGAESITAVMHPKAGNSLYFVARGNGSHQFSDTLEQHEAAVDTYQRKNHATR
ncbi:MAG: endolytic transglycosylase MltG [Methylococcaceae bacterium]